MNRMTDKQYVEKRDALISEAAGIASTNNRSGSTEWSYAFLYAMDELAVKAGLVQSWVMDKYTKRPL